ncbi:MAG: CidA/LrgA family protein [Lachnospiraceae bacterium]|nr:CidA/LrgA family protein [Lachnospiraceae bacterium]
MKYVKQFSIIMIITFIGEVMHFLLPLPVPTSIYGLVLMLVALLAGILKVEQVRETGRFLIEIMPMLFIPAGVGLMDAWDVLQPNFLSFAVITVVSTIVVMAVTGVVTQFIIQKERKDD